MLVHSLNRGHFLVNTSHSPVLMSLSIMCLGEGIIMILKGGFSSIMFLPFFLNLLILIKDQLSMGSEGQVGKDTNWRYLISFYWFVAAEALAFLSLISSWFFKCFWMTQMKMVINLNGIGLPSPLGLGLMNSALLLSSSATITYAHHSFMAGEMNIAKSYLDFTLLLGVVFLGVQWVEFSTSNMNISNGFSGSLLFSSLGFHGLHVLVGVVLLLISYKFILRGTMTSKSHCLFKSSIIYWHFVDVVWVFVYCSYYLLF
uniref:Cytochrome c oxidase subunit 3 n=1 Tax=Thetys vagina TaxID=942565 RepID=A0AA86IJW1_9UROC|nr:cytochrome c oxidase subunit III [Thetys vagina]